MAENIDVASLRARGIDPSKTSIADLVKLLEEQVEIIEEHNKAFNAGKAEDAVTKAAREKFATEDKTLENMVRDFADSFFTYVQNNPTAAIVAYDSVRTVLEDVKAERDYRMDSVLRILKRDGNVPETQSEKAESAYNLQVALNALIDVRLTVLKSDAEVECFGDKSAADKYFRSKLPANFVKAPGKDGKQRYDRPNERKLASGEVSRRVVSNEKLAGVQFTWIPKGGEAITFPVGTMLDDIAFQYISRGAYRVSGFDVDTRIRKTKDAFYTKEGGMLDFETGTLSGQLI